MNQFDQGEMILETERGYIGRAGLYASGKRNIILTIPIPDDVNGEHAKAMLIQCMDYATIAADEVSVSKESEWRRIIEIEKKTTESLRIKRTYTGEIPDFKP